LEVQEAAALCGRKEEWGQGEQTGWPAPRTQARR